MIVIAGDSWGLGEWEANSRTTTKQPIIAGDRVCHQGLEYYLTEQGHNVLNLSIRGGSNSMSFEALEKWFNKSARSNEITSIKHIFVFQTDWLRDFYVKPPGFLGGLIQVDKGEFWSPVVSRELINIYLSRFYYSLSNLACEYNVKIGLIGGLGDTMWFDNFEQEYPGLFIACQSFTNLCLHDNHRIQEPVFGVGFTNTFIKYCVTNANNIEEKEFFIKQMELADDKLKLFERNPKWFFPDGIHPNRFAHEKLFGYLKFQNYI